MADAPPATATIDEDTLKRRTGAIVRALAETWWLPPLCDAHGAGPAIWVLARALAPFYENLPGFNWAGSGTIDDHEFPSLTTYAGDVPGVVLTRLDEVRLIVDPAGRDYDDMEHPVLVIGIRSTRPPTNAEVFAEIEDLHAEDEDPVIADPTRVDVASPLGYTMYRQPAPGRSQPFPLIVPVGISGNGIDAAVKMGEFLARRLASHYRLVPA